MDAPGWARHLPEGTATVDLLEHESLPRRWSARWEEDPAATVLEDAHGTRVGADELQARSAEIARRYAGAGLEPGDRLIVSAEASVELIIAYVAALRYGLVVVPMNSAYGETEIAHIVHNTTPAAALIDDEARGRWIEAADGRCRIVGVDVALPAGPAPLLDAADRTTPALICHTSGTTGKPKGAVLTNGNLLASAEAVAMAWRWERADKLALSLPLFHLHGLGVGVHGTLVAGASLVLTGPFHPSVIAEAIAKQGATLFFGVPTMYHRLAQSPEVAELARLRLCVSGSAPLPASLHQALQESCGQRVLERYGMTETVMNVSNPYDGERRPGTVGFPLPGVDVRLDGDADAGEIQLKGPNVFPGYWNDPASTDATFTEDGWLMSGDIGAFDSDGYLSIVGRSKELIITGGYNVYPREIEDVLRACPGVADVAVVGLPSDEWGETVTAFVVAAGERNSQSIIDFAAERLAGYKKPRQVRFIDELPRNALGKVLRDELTRS